MAINQAYLFLIFSLNGIFVGLLFDFFRILRRVFKTVNLITNIEDIIFWILTGISIIFCMYKFSDGSLRLFMFLGLIFGILIYFFTLSDIIIKVNVKIIHIEKKIIKIMITPFIAIFNFIEKHFIRKVNLLCIKIQNFMTKKSKKVLDNVKKIKKK